MPALLQQLQRTHHLTEQCEGEEEQATRLSTAYLLHDQTGLAFCGLNCSNAFMRSLALVISLASRNLQDSCTMNHRICWTHPKVSLMLISLHSDDWCGTDILWCPKFSVALIVIVETMQWLIWSSNIWSFQTCAIIAWCLLLPQLQVSSQAQGEHKQFLHRKHHLCC